MALPPGPRTPAAVNLARFAYAPLDTLAAWQQRYGDIFTVKFAGFGTGVYVGDQSEIRKLFTGDQSELLAGEANSIMTPVLGEHSVLVLDGPEHLRQRRLLLPPFQGQRIGGFRALITDVAERTVDGWQPGSELVMREEMRRLTFEVIAHAVFGVHDPVRIERLRDALMAVIDSNPIMLIHPLLHRDLGGRFTLGGRFHQRMRAADALLFEEIALRRAAPDLDERTDVLSLLLRARDEDGQPMTDRELRDELFTMLAAGHETTATSLTFALDLLCRTPRALAALQSALADGDADRYLAAVGKETLRLRPIIDAVERTLTTPRMVCGYELPAGVKVYPGIALVHMRTDLYPVPEEFRPERFLGDAVEPYSWLPFGGGIRRCIGAALAHAELEEVLRVVVSRVELEPVNREPDRIFLRGITLQPRHGVRMRVQAVRERAPERVPALA